MTRYLGVISGPGKKSTSPAFQQAALDHLGLDIQYQHWPTPPDQLAARIESLRSPGMLGANVTIPHKEAVLRMLDDVDGLVRRVGAANTILNREGRLLGSNTDVEGFLRALREYGGFEPDGRRAVVAGAGGAARAVVTALIEAGAEAVTVINRTLSRAARLIDDMRADAPGTHLEALPDTLPAWTAAASAAELLINCTSVGSEGTAEEQDSPMPAGVITGKHLVFDLIYRLRETRLMSLARSQGARVLGGLPMLVYQGAESFELWTGREAPLPVMFAAAEKALGQEPGR